MRFDDLDRIMRTYEESLDQYIEPEKFIIARLDGRSFTKLTKETCDFKKPFDAGFRDLMVGTVMHLMKDCGFNIARGFTGTITAWARGSRQRDSTDRVRH